ncbi:MAG: hypothetical protein Kow0065_04600 [Methylomicrobium sp.]
MPNIQPITLERYNDKRWLRSTSYAFAATETVAPLVAQELIKAMMNMPLGFIKSETGFIPVAIQGMTSNKNLFVSAEGHWLGGYIPAVYRGYPFHLIRVEDGRQVLCFNEDSGLLTDTATGELFFSEDNTPSKAVTDVMNFLSQVEANRIQTARVCELLEKLDLFQPWHIKVKSEEGEKILQGIYRIDEEKLNRLALEEFDQIRQIGALPVIYSQLLSMQNLAKLVELARVQSRSSIPLPTDNAGNIDLEFLNKGGTINLSNL